MGETIMEIREIREKDYASAIDVSNIAIKELFGTEPAFDFNFKVKNVFVTPGNVTRALYVDKMMVGLFVLTEERFIHNDKKKLNINFFYILEEYRTKENMDEVFRFIENFALTNGNVSIGFDSSLPHFSNHLVDTVSDVKQQSIHFEKAL